MERGHVAKHGAMIRGVCVALAAAAMAAAASCTSTPPPVGLAEGCSINSDCEGSLVCAFGRCHVACVTSKDCSGGAACVVPGVCQLPSEVKCSDQLPCVTGLICSGDHCVASCAVEAGASSAGLCLGDQVCTEQAGQQVCATVNTAADGGTHEGGHSSDGGTRDGSTRDGATRDGTVPMDAPIADTGKDGGHDAGFDAGHDAAMGCDLPEAGAGPLGYMPSNFNPLDLVGLDGGSIPIDASSDGGSIDWSTAPNVDVSSNCGTSSGTYARAVLSACLHISPVAINLGGESADCYPNCFADLYVMNSLKVESGVEIRLMDGNNAATNNPIILAVRGIARIDGRITVTQPPTNGNAGNGIPGPGGFSVNGLDLGPGGGVIGEVPALTATSGPGGAGFCGHGGGGGFTGFQAAGGDPYGLPTIIPLQGGSAGGSINLMPSGDAPGGAGGGGLQISAGISIIVSSSGIIDANGSAFGGGGGAGGAILLEAPTVSIQGIVVANGAGGGSHNSAGSIVLGNSGNLNAVPALGAPGAGSGGGGVTPEGGAGSTGDGGLLGGGGGGAGWIRINTSRGCSFTSTLDLGTTVISPSLGSGCASTGLITP